MFDWLMTETEITHLGCVGLGALGAVCSMFLTWVWRCKHLVWDVEESRFERVSCRDFERLIRSPTTDVVRKVVAVRMKRTPSG